MNENKHLPRRNFIKLSALSAVSLGIPLNSNSNNMSVPDDKLYYQGKQTRLTIAMWDFSWLTAHHKGGAYENLEQRVAEAAERGFNTLRIDCFPSRLMNDSAAEQRSRSFRSIWLYFTKSLNEFDL